MGTLHGKFSRAKIAKDLTEEMVVQNSSEQQQRGKANIRLALILGVVAFGFFLAGLYMATGGGA